MKGGKSRNNEHLFVLNVFWVLLWQDMKDDGTSIIYIQNISPSDTTDLRKALRRIGHVRNFLPLLNKVLNIHKKFYIQTHVKKNAWWIHFCVFFRFLWNLSRFMMQIAWAFGTASWEWGSTTQSTGWMYHEA